MNNVPIILRITMFLRSYAVPRMRPRIEPLSEWTVTWDFTSLDGDYAPHTTI